MTRIPPLLRFLPLLGLAVTLPGGQKQAEILEIATAGSALVLAVAPDAPVVFRHYGGRTAGADAFLYKGHRDGPEVYPAFGGTNFANLALSVVHADGSLTTELVYAGHERRALDAGREETVVHLKDKLYPLTVDLHFTAHKAEDVITQRAVLSHREKAPVRVETIASACLPLQAGAYYLTHFHGAWGREMRVTEEKLTPGGKIIEEYRKGVQTTMSDNPSFMLALEHPADEEAGEVYAGALAWSGNYRLSFAPDELETLHITAGMNPFAAARMVAPGEALETPAMVLTYSARGRGQASRNLHDWSRRHALAHGGEPRAILLNSWEGAYFAFDEKTLTGMMDDAAALGIEMFVLDDGWFGNKHPRNDARAGLGDWQVNRQKLPRGIGHLADYAVSKGLRFGIWIEPEMVNPRSELAENHPEWVVKSPGREIPQRRNQWVLDLSNPAVQDFVEKVFDDTVALSPNITYIKWDANRPVWSAGSEYLPADRQTHFWKDYVDGLYKVYERVRAKHPDITIQLCSSGGARLDYGALKYHDEFWASDNTNAVDRVLIQYGAGMIYPAIATASHVSASPNHQTGMMVPLKFRFDVAMSGRLGMELQPKDIAGADLEFARRAIQNYKRIRPVVQLGDLYRLCSPYDEKGRAALAYVSKDRKEAVLFAYNLYHFHARGFTFDVKLKGLDPAKTYTVSELNMKTSKSVFPGNKKTFTGDYLMKAGVSLSIPRPQESAVLHMTEK
ncbi:MAG: alpha-galactosidase [Opitutaceae bacterium]|jgi:alpha-galactosidase|nr:alpha-galactosidase [Opitutaceae bacterium]